VQVIPPPPSIQINQLTSDTDIFVFEEQANYVLPVDVQVDGTTPGVYSSPSVPGGTIAAGTTINSYVVHSDPASGLPMMYTNRTISFTNNEAILAIILLTDTLDNSTPTLAFAGTQYPPPAKNWGLEPGVEPDSITWAGETITWNTLTGGSHDQGGEDDIRILTMVTPIPEPHALWLLLPIALFAIWRARRQTKSA
jgi:hypothetical protein